jgi:hypothetical protein
MIATIVVGITITSCKKESNFISETIPSPAVAQKGTPISGTTPYANQVQLFMDGLNACRMSSEGDNIPVYYDERLVQYTDTMTSSVENRIKKDYYITKDGVSLYPCILSWTKNIKSPSEFFADIIKKVEETKVTLGYKQFFGYNHEEQRYVKYDLIGVRIQECNNQCLPGFYKVKVVFLVFLPSCYL